MPRIVVAAPSSLAAGTGAEVADMGGSLVDAVLAATLTAMCTEPGVCAPGGGGFITIWPADADPTSIDGYMAVPGLGLDPDRPISGHDVSMDYGGGITTGVGPASIAVPGGLAALDAIHRRWGRLPWREVIGHVADTLADGFPLPRACHYYLGFSGEEIFGRDPASRRALHDGDRLLSAGETVVMPDMIDSLRQIASEGVETFYRGELAERIVADLTARGSRLTREDLSTYKPVVSRPLTSVLGGWTVATTPPPAVGGVTLSAILRTVHASGDPTNPDVWIEAQATVFRQRRSELEPTADRQTAGWEMINRFPEAGSTVSITAAAADGSVCSATMSAGYGSGVIPHGTGLWMNNSLGELELNPVPLAAGRRLMSNMAPTVARDHGRRLAIGSPGADRITSALAISLTLIMSGMPLPDAVEHPRLHVELDRGTVAFEPGLAIAPHTLEPRQFPSRDMYFGGATAVEFAGGSLKGHADSRRTGGVASGGGPTPDKGP